MTTEYSVTQISELFDIPPGDVEAWLQAGTLSSLQRADVIRFVRARAVAAVACPNCGARYGDAPTPLGQRSCVCGVVTRGGAIVGGLDAL